MNWEKLVERYESRVLLISRSILGDEDLSHDAAQESLVKLRKTDGRIRDLDAWVATVAGNTARDFRRRRAKHSGLRSLGEKESFVKPTTETPADRAIHEESRDVVRDAIRKLAPADRDVILLKFREGMSGPDIARALGISMTAAWQRVSRALKTLRSILGECHEPNLS